MVISTEAISQIRYKILKVRRVKSGVAVGARLLLIGEYSNCGIARLGHAENSLGSRICANPVVVPVGTYHTAVKAYIYRF